MTTASAVIARFESQLGVTENPMGSNRVPYNPWYGITPSPWCATYVSWCFFHEGLPLPASTSKGFAYTPSGAAWFRKAGKWTTKPARGHVVFFDFPGDGVDRISHVGIVTGVNADGSIDTIEGNTDERGGRTGGKVMRRRRAVGIVGYGIPAYSVPVPKPTPAPPTTSPTEAEGMKLTTLPLIEVRSGPGGAFGLDERGMGTVIVPVPFARFDNAGGQALPHQQPEGPITCTWGPFEGGTIVQVWGKPRQLTGIWVKVLDA